MEEEIQTPKAGLIYDDRYIQHNPGLLLIPSTRQPMPFVEPELHRSNHRLAQRSKQLIDLTGLSDQMTAIPAAPAGRDDIASVHSNEYIDRVIEICEAGGGDVGEGAQVGPGSYEIALLAAGGAMAAVDAVFNGDARRVIAIVRPPGHHAVRDKGMGFCVFNNVAVAAHHARQSQQLERIAIIDWDVHHGNGTQDAFYDDPQVLFISLHQEHLYPSDSGTLQEDGTGDGVGYNVNIPLPAGSGDAAYLAAFDRLVLPVLDAFQPELIMISAGQDASTMDPLGRMCVTTEGYRRMTSLLINRAERHASGRLVVLLEGGYSEVYAPYCTLAIAETLAGVQTNIPEPITYDRIRAHPHHASVGRDADAALQAAVEHHAQHWDVLN